MSTQYDRRLHLIVPVADQSAANTEAAGLDPDTGGSDTFSVALSADGNDPATHYGCCVSVVASIVPTIESKQQTLFPSGKVYRGYCDHDFEPGITRWTFDTAIADMGLQKIEDEI